MVLDWLKRRRRRKLLAGPFPENWLAILRDNVPHYAGLPASQQARLRDLLRVFVAEKHWTGCGGLEMTDEVRVTIAAEACLLLLGIDGDYCFDRVRSILVYPSAFEQPEEQRSHQTLVEEHVALSGQAWQYGPVVLAWTEVVEGARRPRDGQNVVIHEFAHQIDGLDGEMGGTPPLPSTAARRRWEQVVPREYERHVERVERGEPTLIQTYGAASRAEFFAVVSECFFEQPRKLRREHPELYDLWRQVYQIDPEEWRV